MNEPFYLNFNYQVVLMFSCNNHFLAVGAALAPAVWLNVLLATVFGLRSSEISSMKPVSNRLMSNKLLRFIWAFDV